MTKHFVLFKNAITVFSKERKIKGKENNNIKRQTGEQKNNKQKDKRKVKIKMCYFRTLKVKEQKENLKEHRRRSIPL